MAAQLTTMHDLDVVRQLHACMKSKQKQIREVSRHQIDGKTRVALVTGSEVFPCRDS